MRITKVRQVLKAFADDTRLRIIHLLSRKELNGADLCRVIGKNQSNISKHLTRLRLLGIAADRRKGNNVYYRLPRTDDKVHKELRRLVTVGFSELAVFQRDLEELKKLKK